MQENTVNKDCFEIPAGPRIDTLWQYNTLAVSLDEQLALHLVLGQREGAIRSAALIALSAMDAASQHWAWLAALNALFTADAELSGLRLDFSDTPHTRPALLRCGLAVAEPDGCVLFPRENFVQQPALWLIGQASAVYPQSLLVSNGKRHPRRPPHLVGTVYRRFIPWLGQWLTLRTVDAQADLEHVHLWMNDPRVARFWEEEGDVDKHRRFIANALADPHVHPLIGCLDGQPFAYFEVYWAKEDRIAPFYAVGDYDRGVHMLVGEAWARGPQHVAAWLPSLIHYILLDDPRTHVVVCEPRVDNARMIAYLQHYGFAYLRQFDFPHKRAALLLLEREVFGQGAWLNGLQFA